MPKMLQVRNVPERLHRELTRRARKAGRSLTDYVQEILEREVGRPRPRRSSPGSPGACRSTSADRPPRFCAPSAPRGRPATALVPDAWALAEYLLRTPRADAVESQLRESRFDLHVPALCDVEVTSVLRRALLAGRMSSERAATAVADYLDLPLARHGHQALLARNLELRANFSAYDAAYVALAKRLGAVLLTADAPLARAATGHLDLAILGISTS